ncbi:MAG: exodeoxyribonuclease VII small subunit [Clostridiales Family XIII bacterium]|jgi:exodeoxyribonuclease VII small subunit|nr:exodeoxyribonuclease VII small subunit [Clostridiales Family XIII bacterium]
MAKRSVRADAEGKGEERSAAPSFEDALAGLERSVEALKGEGTTLEGVVKNFETGMAYYERCEAILREAKQKIAFYGKDGV